jgi:hypothetical protein
MRALRIVPAFLVAGLLACEPTAPTDAMRAPQYSRVDDNTITYVFSFNSTGFQFDFGNRATVQTGSFSYDADNPVSFSNGQGFYVVDFNFVPSLSFDPQFDIGWVPQPTFDESTVETLRGQLKVLNDQWGLVDSGGNIVFQISAIPDGDGGFTGFISGGAGPFTTVTYTLVVDGKVTICHKPGTPAEGTLAIPIAALDPHLGHGDTIGLCQ